MGSGDNHAVTGGGPSSCHSNSDNTAALEIWCCFYARHFSSALKRLSPSLSSPLKRSVDIGWEERVAFHCEPTDFTLLTGGSALISPR